MLRGDIFFIQALGHLTKERLALFRANIQPERSLLQLRIQRPTPSRIRLSGLGKTRLQDCRYNTRLKEYLQDSTGVALSRTTLVYIM